MSNERAKTKGFSLADQLFNVQSVGRLADEFETGVPGFERESFVRAVVSGLAERTLLDRLEWIADCLEPHLSSEFSEMAEQLQAALPEKLDPTLKDDDFGSFIHAVFGILAVRHGLEAHRDRALDLVYEATKRFSMEFYIRPFINRWPEETLARLTVWSTDANYHVRRLVSEGTRPKLPWAKNIDLAKDVPLPLLDTLHADDARFVTRSVSNHLNDIAKFEPDLVVNTLKRWHEVGKQSQKELDWMTRHALRTLVKQGHQGALELLGYHANAPVTVDVFDIKTPKVAAGDALEFEVILTAPEKTPVIVDYQIWFQQKNGKQSAKVFKLKQAVVPDGKPLRLTKRHVLKANATTFTLYEGAHKLSIQVNGQVLCSAGFDVSL